MTIASSRNPTRQDRYVVMKPPSSGPTAAAIAAAADECVHPLLRPWKLPWIKDCIGEQQRCTETAQNGPEDDDRPQVLRQRHRDGADGVAERPNT